MNIFSTLEPDDKDCDFIRSQLRSFNLSHLHPDTEHLGTKKFAAFIKNDRGEIEGGATTSYGWDWLHLQLLWIDEKHRGKSMGKRLLEEVEKAAKGFNCIGIHLETTSFQAKDFYESQGFDTFGELDDYPRGFKTYFMRKQIN